MERISRNRRRRSRKNSRNSSRGSRRNSVSDENKAQTSCGSWRDECPQGSWKKDENGSGEKSENFSVEKSENTTVEVNPKPLSYSDLLKKKTDEPNVNKTDGSAELSSDKGIQNLVGARPDLDRALLSNASTRNDGQVPEKVIPIKSRASSERTDLRKGSGESANFGRGSVERQMDLNFKRQDGRRGSQDGSRRSVERHQEERRGSQDGSIRRSAERHQEGRRGSQDGSTRRSAERHQEGRRGSQDGSIRRSAERQMDPRRGSVERQFDQTRRGSAERQRGSDSRRSESREAIRNDDRRRNNAGDYSRSFNDRKNSGELGRKYTDSLGRNKRKSDAGLPPDGKNTRKNSDAGLMKNSDLKKPGIRPNDPLSEDLTDEITNLKREIVKLQNELDCSVVDSVMNGCSDCDKVLIEKLETLRQTNSNQAKQSNDARGIEGNKVTPPCFSDEKHSNDIKQPKKDQPRTQSNVVKSAFIAFNNKTLPNEFSQSNENQCIELEHPNMKLSRTVQLDQVEQPYVASNKEAQPNEKQSKLKSNVDVQSNTVSNEPLCFVRELNCDLNQSNSDMNDAAMKSNVGINDSNPSQQPMQSNCVVNPSGQFKIKAKESEKSFEQSNVKLDSPILSVKFDETAESIVTLKQFNLRKEESDINRKQSDLVIKQSNKVPIQSNAVVDVKSNKETPKVQESSKQEVSSEQLNAARSKKPNVTKESSSGLSHLDKQPNESIESNCIQLNDTEQPNNKNETYTVLSNEVKPNTLLSNVTLQSNISNNELSNVTLMGDNLQSVAAPVDHSEQSNLPLSDMTVQPNGIEERSNEVSDVSGHNNPELSNLSISNATVQPKDCKKCDEVSNSKQSNDSPTIAMDETSKRRINQMKTDDSFKLDARLSDHSLRCTDSKKNSDSDKLGVASLNSRGVIIKCSELTDKDKELGSDSSCSLDNSNGIANGVMICDSVCDNLESEMKECSQNVKSMSRSKQKGKHKMREMNQKGVDKEGTDMDAFVDTKNNENNNRNNNDNATSQQQDHTNNNQINNQTGEEDKEESLVQAKNEENSKLNAVRSDNESAEQDNDKASSEEESGPEDDESSQLSNKQLALKYQYKEDQWSPLNPEGKKIYDRDFLMKLRDDPLSAKKPDIMTDVEIFVKEGQQGAQPGLRRMNSHSQHGGYTGFSSGSMRGSNNGALLPDFFNRSMSQRMPPKRNSSQGGGGRGPGGGGNRSLKLMYNNSMSMKDDYKWVQSENAWKPTKMTRGGDNKSKEERETEELYKKVRGILNKLTPQKFGTLVTQFQNLPINSLLRLQGTIGLVFEKAVDEPAFSVSYAHLCKVLGKLEVNEKQPSGAEKQNQENQQPAKQSVHFRKLLITKCQQEFETNKKLELDFEKRQQDINENPDPEKRKELQILFNEEERKIRMKSVGLVTFIGELFKLKMLTANIMHGCIKQLLGKIDEESLECLCKLLTTIGKEFEEQINSSKNNNQSGIQEFNEYFQQMTKLSRKHEGSKVSSRVRFMLQDVIELRMNNWVPRRDENKPKTMAQIQAEVERESERQAAMLAAQPLRHQNQNLNQDRGGNRRNNPRGGGNVQSEDGWNTVGSNKYRSNNYAAEASKIQGLKALAGQELMDKNTRSEMTLGPSNSFRSWGAGSGARSAAPTSTNAFSILDDEKRLPLGRIQRDEKESDKSKLLQNISSFIRSTSQNDRDGRENRGRGQSGGSPSPSLSGPQRKPIQMLPRSQAAGSEDNSRESTPALTPQTSTDTSRTETQPPVEKAEPAQPKEKLDEEHLKQYATTLIKEYIDNQNIQESIESYKELFTEDSGVFILTCLDFLLEQSKRDKRFKVSTLLGLLARNNMFTSQSLVSEIGCIFESINDVAVDVPHIWQYMGEVFGDIMCLGGLDFSHLKECIRRIPPKVKNKMDQTMKELFRILSLEKGPVWIKSVWDSCNVHIKDFISDDTMADKFLIEHAYLEGKEVEASDSNLPYDRIQDKLLSFLKDNKENFDTICGWLTSNVGHRTRDPKFIRQLTEAIIKSSLVNNDNKVQLDNKLLKRCIALLKRYIDNIEELELSCLYSVQYLVVITLESPFGMLVEIFNELYESATISAEGFNKWKCEENFVENWQREGRGVAIASLKNFFQILHEDAQDDQDDEPS